MTTLQIKADTLKASPHEIEIVSYSVARSSLGLTLVATSVAGVCAILLGDNAATLVAELAERLPHARLVAGLSDRVTASVIAFLDRTAPLFGLPLAIQGTDFQRAVWSAISKIPTGETRSYAELAAAIGRRGAARAVASACAANPFAVVIPCHRVVASGGKLGGYRWGTARKRSLLARERA